MTVIVCVVSREGLAMAVDSRTTKEVNGTTVLDGDDNTEKIVSVVEPNSPTITATLNAAVTVSGRARFNGVPASNYVSDAINNENVSNMTVHKFFRHLSAKFYRLSVDYPPPSDFNLVVAGYSPSSIIPEIVELRISRYGPEDHDVDTHEVPIQVAPGAYLLRGDLFDDQEVDAAVADDCNAPFGITHQLLNDHCMDHAYDPVFEMETSQSRDLTLSEAIKITKKATDTAYREADMKKKGVSTIGGKATLVVLRPGHSPEVKRWLPQP